MLKNFVSVSKIPLLDSELPSWSPITKVFMTSDKNSMFFLQKETQVMLVWIKIAFEYCKTFKIILTT